MWSFFSRDPCKDFCYDVGDIVQDLEEKSIWSLHKGKKRGSNEQVSILLFDVKNATECQMDVAKGALKRLKTLRHPSILTFVDSFESDKLLYLVTEYVEPLAHHMTTLHLEGPQKDLYIAWGIFQITVIVWIIIF